MSPETEYQRLRREAAEARSPRATHGPKVKFPPEVAKARNAERTRRSQEARRRASLVMATRYPEEFTALMDAERAAIDADKGPLPGDPNPMEA